MKLTDFINRKAIIPNLKAKDKKAAIQELVQAMKKSSDGERFSVTEIVNGVMEREKLGSTGVGTSVGVPHAKLPGIKNVIGAFGRSKEGLDFNAVDGEAVHLVFLILSPPSKSEAYLQALQKVMLAIRRQNFLKFLKAAHSVKDIEVIFKEVEEVASV